MHMEHMVWDSSIMHDRDEMDSSILHCYNGKRYIGTDFKYNLSFLTLEQYFD